MIKDFAQRHHLSLRHGQNVRIIFVLLLNYFRHTRLHLYKKKHGINKPIVHYYAVCWNEETMLPWMFKHYERFVDHFTIYDNYSTDHTENIIQTHSNAEIVKFGERDKFDDAANQKIKNQCWKQSRGKADLVIVCDLDEFLYHPNIESTLQSLCQEKITFPNTVGYEMYGEALPSQYDNKQLTDFIKKGKRSQWFDKHIIFDPHRIVDTYFDPGAHHANPTGIVRRGAIPLKVLHYKNLGLDYLLARYLQLGNRLSSFNIEEGLGTHYLAKEEELKKQFLEGLKSSEKIIE